MIPVPQCVQHTSGNIDELKRKQDLESLRPFILREKCFPPNQLSGHLLPIGMEELKKLARAWKLNERRNFWKNHDTRDKMVAALCHYVEEKQRLKASTSSLPHEGSSAMGSYSRHERSQMHMGSTDSLNDLSISTTQSTFLPREPSISKPSKTPPAEVREMRNYCGLVKLFNYPTAEELITKTRHNEAPKPALQPETLINEWRGEDFYLGGAAAEGGSADGSAVVSSTLEAVEMSAGDATRKHRSLSQHLYHFALCADPKTKPITIGVLQTFIDLAETKDFLAALSILVGGSNLLQFQSVRNLLIEINGFHKISALVPLTMQYVPSALLASSLMYYYYSCDSDIEDRVFNEAYSTLGVNFESDLEEIRMTTLLTLNNLLPSISRPRIVDLIMKVVATRLLASPTDFGDEVDRQEEETFLLFLGVLSNASTFANVHPTMFRSRASEALLRLSAYARRFKASKIALSVAVILNNFLNISEASKVYITEAVAEEFVEIIKNLLSFHSNIEVLSFSLRCLVVMSAAPEFVSFIARSEVISLVTTIVLQTDVSKIGPVMTEDFAKFFFNLTCAITQKVVGVAEESSGSSSKVLSADVCKSIDTFVSYGIHECCLRLVDTRDRDANKSPITKFAMTALQNLLGWSFTQYQDVVSVCMEPLLEVIRATQSVAAIMCIYNICCQCRSADGGESKIELLAQNMIHIKFLDMFSKASGNLEASSAYLEVLVQMSGDRVVADLFDGGLLQILADRVKPLVTTSMRRESFVSNSSNSASSIARLVESSSKLVLAVTSIYCADDHRLQKEELHDILRVLHIVATSRIDNLLVNQTCASALAFLSLADIDYDSAKGVVEALMRVSRRDENMMESLSIFLHNVSMAPGNVSAMLQDDAILNFLITMLRSGSIGVQLNVLETFRTLCSYSECVGLMTRSTILSDLIVVGMLRTSSAEIKDVCSEAFYNILTHEAYRRLLLDSEFWWGFSRLCREPFDSIRVVSSRALYDLSCTCDLGVVSSLRAHGIFALALDLVSSPTIPTVCMERVLFAANNLISNFANIAAERSAGEPYMTPQETLQVVRIALEVLLKCPARSSAATGAQQSKPSLVGRPSVKATIGFHPSKAGATCAIALMACAVQRAPIGAADAECLNYDLLDLLTNSIPLWSADDASLVSVSVLLACLASSETFIKTIAIADVAAVLCATYSDRPTVPVAENLCRFFLHYLRLEGAVPAQLLAIPSFLHLACDCLRVSRSTVQAPGYEGSRPKLELAVPTGGANRLDELFLTVVCMCLEPLSLLLNAYNSTAFVAGFFRSESYVTNPDARRGLLMVIQHFSTVPRLSRQMLSSDLFTTLLAVHKVSRLGSREAGVAAAKFNSIILKNLCLHGNVEILRTLLRGTEGSSTNALDVISATLSDSSGGDAVGGNIAVVFYKAAAAAELADASPRSVTPQYMLDTISRMNNGMIDDPGNLYINKATVGTILERYSEGIDVDPAFVHGVFAEMKNPLIAAVPSTVARMVPEGLGGDRLEVPSLDLLLGAPPDRYVCVVSRARAANMWSPCVCLEKKRLAASHAFHSFNSVIRETEAAPSEAYPYPPFSKVVRQYGRVTIDFAHAAAALQEGVEEAESG